MYTCKCVTIYPYKNKSKTGRSNLRKVNSNQRSPRRIQSNPSATLQTPTATWTDMDEAGFLEIERKDGQDKVSEKIDEDTTPSSITSNGTDYFDWFGILGLFHKIVLSQNLDLGALISLLLARLILLEIYIIILESSYRNGY